MSKETNYLDSYESPHTRMITVSPARVIADSVRGLSLQDMQNNEIFEDEDF